jgi:hypothetical protein
MSNYDTILREKDNNDSFDNNAMEKNWSELEKKLDGQIKPPSNFKRIVKAIVAVAAVAIVAFFSFKFLKNKKNIPEIAVNTEIKSAIKPALTWTNLPYEKFEFDAAIGDTLFTQNGSILVFPANALVNSKGEIVQGKIEVQSREFNDALDYSIAGVPMAYDSAGIKYTFISSGMIDIKANQNGEALQVNPNSKPTLNLVSTNREKNTNLYKLDTITGVWTNKGKDKLSYIKNITDIRISDELSYLSMERESDSKYYSVRKNEKSISNDGSDYFPEEDITKPLPPQKPSNKNPLINIEFVPGSFKELAIYDGLKFEVISQYSTEKTSKQVVPKVSATAPKPSLQIEKKSIQNKLTNPIIKNNQPNTNTAIDEIKQPTYNNLTESVARNSKIDWENIELVKTNTEGEYRVIFTSGQQKVIYVVKPVLEGTAYAAAEKVYQQKMAEYEKVKNNRLQDLSKQQNENDAQQKNDSIADAQMIAQNNKVNAKNIKTEAENVKAEAENIKTEALNKIIEARNVLVAARNKFMEEQYKIIKDRFIIEQRTRKKIELELAQSTEILRSFTIDGFGYWNCDQPTIPTPMYVQASFLNTKNKTLEFNRVNVVVKNVNRFLGGDMYSLPYLPNQQQCVFAFANDKFYYLSYSQFTKLNITSTTKSFNFILNEFTGDKNDYNNLKKLLVEQDG